MLLCVFTGGLQYHPDPQVGSPHQLAHPIHHHIRSQRFPGDTTLATMFQDKVTGLQDQNTRFHVKYVKAKCLIFSQNQVIKQYFQFQCLSKIRFGDLQRKTEAANIETKSRTTDIQQGGW